jgi:ribonucleoside-diphosphate reductase alpha chain
MKYTENMTFEEASKALIDELNANLATLHQNYHVEQADWNKLYDQIANVVSEETHLPVFSPEVMEVRPRELECDVVRFQNNKEKWVALVGLLDGHPYEIFTGLQDEDEGIMLPKSVSKGKIVKTILDGGLKRYDFQFVNKRGYKITVEGLSEKFNPEYWNYAKLISGVLRYRMPIEHVIKLVYQLQLTSDNINTWKKGVVTALKRYLKDGSLMKLYDDSDSES